MYVSNLLAYPSSAPGIVSTVASTVSAVTKSIEYCGRTIYKLMRYT